MYLGPGSVAAIPALSLIPYYGLWGLEVILNTQRDVALYEDPFLSRHTSRTPLAVRSAPNQPYDSRTKYARRSGRLGVEIKSSK